MPHRPPFPRAPVSAALILLAAGGAWAAPAGDAAKPAEEGRWALCPPMAPLPTVPRQASDVTTINADQATAEQGESSIFRGNVVVVRDGRQLEADQAVYHRKNDTLDVTGHVQLVGEDYSLWGDSAHLDLGNQTGWLSGARYRIEEAHAFGTAERIELQGSGQSKFTGATYTTCPPGHESWLLDARRLELDRGTNTGEARDVVLHLGGVPVLYTPYLNFPLEGRKSGLLPPILGTAGRNGTDIGVPYYWNIAPDRDATFTPRYLSARGGMLMSEFRYLNQDNSGQLNVDALPNDKQYEGERQQRGMLRYRHDQRFDERWNGSVFLQGVSDPAYLNDIDNTLASSSARHLERRADVSYQGDGWSFLGRVQEFQPLLRAVTDYERMPQLLAVGGGRRDRLRYDFRTEFVNFENPSPVTTGSRVDLYPGVSLPFGESWWFITPRAAARYTQYELKGAAGDGTPNRSVSVASLDSGLFFERELQAFDTPLVQTLEPRLYYLYVPYRDQSGLPVFDTDPMTFSFDQLFRENRYSGPDRVGDANQITAALTSRVLRNDNGVEAVRASIGEIYYFKNPRVTLPGEIADDPHHSDIAGEIAAHPIEPLEISAATRWNPDISDAEETVSRIRYKPDETRLIDAAWSYRDAGREINRDVLVLWPVAQRWHFVGRWFYDLVEERTLESVVGLQYQTCCWSVRGVVRDKPFLDEDNSLQSDRSIYFTFELKGLATLGSSLESVIDHGMVGL